MPRVPYLISAALFCVILAAGCNLSPRPDPLSDRETNDFPLSDAAGSTDTHFTPSPDTSIPGGFDTSAPPVEDAHQPEDTMTPQQDVTPSDTVMPGDTGVPSDILDVSEDAFTGDVLHEDGDGWESDDYWEQDGWEQDNWESDDSFGDDWESE